MDREDYLRYVNQIMSDTSLDIGIPDDIVLHLPFNNNCNCRCKFCQLDLINAVTRDNSKRKVIPEKFLYEDLLMLYPHMSRVRTTFAEITACKEGFEYLCFLHEKFPHINLAIETNGLAFNDKWINLAVDSLMHVHFSINAINEEYFRKTVWDKEGIYPIIQKNFNNYISILKQKDLFEFKPSVSCVINSLNYDTIVDFVKQYLEKGIQTIVFYFDITQKYSSSNLDYKDAIITVLELEKILCEKVDIRYLFVPTNHIEKYEKIVEENGIDYLKNKYFELLNIVKNFQSLDEWYSNLEKKQIKLGKKTSPSELEDSCQNPYRSISINYDGGISVCCLRKPEDNIKYHKKNGVVDWHGVFNSFYYRNLRYNFKKEHMIGCPVNCKGNL